MNSTNVVNIEQAPMRSQYSKAQHTNCIHARLTFNFDDETVTCRNCGMEWRDFLGECKVTK